jgi:predicted RNase H-like HicB family nuclease
MRYTVVLEQEPDGGYVIAVPALSGCVSQGDARAEALANIREAIELYVEDCPCRRRSGSHRGRNGVRRDRGLLNDTGGRREDLWQSGSHMILRRDMPYSRVIVPDHRQIRVGTL